MHARILLVAGSVLIPLPGLAQSKADLAFGKTLASENCARCHAIGPKGASPVKGVPPFRALYQRYDLDNLQEAFVEGVAVGHRGVDMPEFQFSPERTDALISYIKSLRPKRK